MVKVILTCVDGGIWKVDNWEDLVRHLTVTKYPHVIALETPALTDAEKLARIKELLA